MIWMGSRELYALFLESDFWRALSRRKRSESPRCARCGARERLQSHHLLYRENWFDTRLEDLEVLCRRCHELEHGIVEGKVVADPGVAVPELPNLPEDVAGRLRDLMRRRSMGEVGRVEFKRMRLEILGGRMMPEHIRVERKKMRKLARPAGMSKKTWRMARPYRGKVKRKGSTRGCTPWHYNKPRARWVNRGTSSN